MSGRLDRVYITWKCEDCCRLACVHGEAVEDWPKPKGWRFFSDAFGDADDVSQVESYCPGCAAKRDAAHEDKMRRWDAGEEFELGPLLSWMPADETIAPPATVLAKKMVTKDTWVQAQCEGLPHGATVGMIPKPFRW